MAEKPERLIHAQVPLLSGKDKETTALALLRFEMRKTRLQFRRVTEARDALENGTESQRTSEDFMNAQARLFADIHFLLVCLKKLDSILYKMQKYFPDDPKLIELRSRYGSEFGLCGDIRDDLEHIEDRPGKGIADLGSTFGPVFQINGKELQIDHQLQATIEAFYSELQSHYDGILTERRMATGETHVWFKNVVRIPEIRNDKNGSL